MKTQRIYVKNLKAMSEMGVDFDGCHAIITGGNNQGKSSFLKTFVDRIRGQKPQEVVKKGEEEGRCEYELTDGSKFVWEVSDSGTEKLSYITKEGLEIDKGVISKLGKRFFGSGFDIDKFLTSYPKKQKQELEKILGIDLSELDEKYQKLYEERKEYGTLKRAEEAKLKDMVIVRTDGIEKIDIDKLQEELVEAEKVNQKHEYITEQIEDKKKRIQELQEDVKKGEEWLKGNVVVDTKDIKEKIEHGKKQNELLENNEMVRRQEILVGKVKKERAKVDRELKQIDAQKTKIISESNLPEGFDFTSDGVIYNGYELDKNTLSSSAIYIASLKLAALALGEIKTVTFDASYLDKKSLKEVEERANKHDLQLLIERPDYDGGKVKYEILS